MNTIENTSYIIDYSGNEINDLLNKVNDLDNTLKEQEIIKNINTTLSSTLTTFTDTNIDLSKIRYIEQENNEDIQKQLLDIIYPLGSIICTSSNEPPISGGQWTLVDRLFINQRSSLTDSKIFTLSEKLLTDGCKYSEYYIKNNENITIRITITFPKGYELNDILLELGTLNYSALGLNGWSYAVTQHLSFSDPIGGGLAWRWTTNYQTRPDVAILQAIDTFDSINTDSDAVDSSRGFDLTFQETICTVTNMRKPEACDKFFWKRVDETPNN